MNDRIWCYVIVPIGLVLVALSIAQAIDCVRPSRRGRPECT